MPSSRGAARDLAQAMGRRFQNRRRVARAVITSVQRDEYGKAISATATIDGAPAQRVYIDQGATITEGDIFDVENYGGAAGPAWYALRRVRTTIPVPQLPYGTALPTPLGLSLTTGLSYKTFTALAWIFARFYLLPAEWGVLVYDLQYVSGDDDPVTVSVGPIEAGEPGVTAELIASIGSTSTVIPRSWSYDLDFPSMGVIKIDEEKIAYTSCTRLHAPWIVPWSVQDFSFHLYDYVEDAFTDTDTTDISAHTPDYDRESGGWYAIPTYSTNWAISSNEVVASPGVSFPYSAALIDAHAGGSNGQRISADWVWPSSGKFGYIVDYDDEDNMTRVQFDADTPRLEVVTRSYGNESVGYYTVFPTSTLTAGQTYRWTVNTYLKNIWVTFSGGDLDEPLTLDMGATYDTDSATLGLYSEVAVTVDNLMIDDPREWDIEDNEFADYAFKQVSFGWTPIVSHAYSATSHMHSFVTTTDPGGFGVMGQIHPCFLGLTRGFDGTTAAAHTAGATIYQEMQGVVLHNLAMGTDYNVRIRARLGDSVVSPWSDWATIETAGDEIAPDAPSSLAVATGDGYFLFEWDGPTLSTTPDLAGFKIYKATDDSGTGAELFYTTGPTNSVSVQAEPGVYYFNITAYDIFGNESGYAETTWVIGVISTVTGQLLSNSDFERSDATAKTIVDWGFSGTGTWGIASGGVGGGKAVGVWDLNSTVSLDWPNGDTGILQVARDGSYYTASIYVGPEDTTMAYLMANDIVTKVYIMESDGSNPVEMSLISSGYIYVGEGWYRAWWKFLIEHSATYPNSVYLRLTIDVDISA